MRTKLQALALLLALTIAGFWYFRGANPGWTKTSVPHKEKDPVTELEVNRYEDRFVPGVDFLGGGLAVAGLMLAGSFFIRRRTGS